MESWGLRWLHSSASNTCSYCQINQHTDVGRCVSNLTSYLDCSAISSKTVWVRPQDTLCQNVRPNYPASPNIHQRLDRIHVSHDTNSKIMWHLFQSVVLREAHRLRVFQNRMLREIFGHKGEKVVQWRASWSQLIKYIIRVIKWEGSDEQGT